MIKKYKIQKSVYDIINFDYASLYTSSITIDFEKYKKHLLKISRLKKLNQLNTTYDKNI